MNDVINFAVVSVIMERLRKYSPESIINECFQEHPDHHRAHLLSKFPESGNILELIPKLDMPHVRELNVFLNNLMPPDERESLAWAVPLK
ncbi:hypothetical protein PV783_34100 [Chitinophaga sp. CC14]|uniref:hypothetical protein n=1 Tax=Chitinophaga sp. CC14 TaxID=3029199 RepID=UPI003B8297F4